MFSLYCGCHKDVYLKHVFRLSLLCLYQLIHQWFRVHSTVTTGTSVSKKTKQLFGRRTTSALLFLCVTDAHTRGPKVQWVLQCQLAEHLWAPPSVINVSFFVRSDFAVAPECLLWPLLTTFQRCLSLNVFYLFLHLPSSLVMLPAADLLRKLLLLLCNDVTFLPLWFVMHEFAYMCSFSHFFSHPLS